MITKHTLWMWLIAFGLGAFAIWGNSEPLYFALLSAFTAGAAAVMSFVDVMLWRVGLGS